MEVSARQPHPSEPGEPRLAAPISRRLPLARAGRAQDLPASLPSPCFAPTFYTVGDCLPRLPCPITTHHNIPSAQLASHSLGAKSPPTPPPVILPRTHTTRHERTYRRIGPCLCDLAHGAPGSQRVIFVAVDGDANFGRLVVESFRWNPAESRTPCSNEPRSRRPLRNVQTQWDEGALSNPGAGTGKLESRQEERAGHKKRGVNQRRGSTTEARPDGRKDRRERARNSSYGQEEEEWRQRQR